MLTTIWIAAVLFACTAARRALCRPGRRETVHWGGRVRLTALWNGGGAFGLPVGRGTPFPRWRWRRCSAAGSGPPRRRV